MFLELVTGQTINQSRWRGWWWWWRKGRCGYDESLAAKNVEVNLSWSWSQQTITIYLSNSMGEDSTKVKDQALHLHSPFCFSELELSFYPFDTMMTLEWQTVIKRTKAWRHFEETDCNGRTNPCFGDFLALLGTRGQEALMRGTLVSIQCIPVMARVMMIIIRIVRIYTVRGNQEN